MERSKTENRVGVAQDWSSLDKVGGEILKIESAVMPGKGKKCKLLVNLGM